MMYNVMYLFQFEFVFYRIVSFYYNKLARNGLPMEEWEKELAKRIIQYSRQVFFKEISLEVAAIHFT